MLYFCGMEEKERRVIIGATEVFMRLGIKSVNMDDVSRSLGISKKTLYQYVKDKNELVRKAMQLHCEIEDNAIDAICAKGLNAIDESFEMMKFISDMLRLIHSSIMFDIEKYHPEIKGEMMENRQSRVFTCIYENINKGIKEGLYRSDLNPKITARLYVGLVELIFKPEHFKDEHLNFFELYLEMFRYHIRGIASEKGIQYLQQKVKEERTKQDQSKPQ
jgi:AcrR family transcriptional regulator